MPQWNRDGHVAKRCLGLVDSTEGALLIDLGLSSAVCLYVVAALWLAA
jgi:hypothetical protein